MTTHPNSRLISCTARWLGGGIVGTMMWPKQHAVAAPANSTIEITALISTVDVASLPMTQVADLF
jgi:hypothetical protein